MTDVPMTTAAEPDGAPRIAVLDILRGVAILGILFMNINDMGQSLFASFGDVRHLGWSAGDRAAWVVREVFADGTARCMLEMLFGAGMVILTDRAVAAAGFWKAMRRYYARNLILCGFGLIHVFVLLWPGDILHTYGIAALIAVLFIQLPRDLLIVAGLSFAAFCSFNGGIGYLAQAQREAHVAAVDARLAAHVPLSEADRATLASARDAAGRRATLNARLHANVQAEDSGRSGGFGAWARAQWAVFLKLEATGLEAVVVWEAAATMLIGAALFRFGLLQGRASRGAYAAMTVLGYAIGTTLRWIAAMQAMRFDAAPQIAWATDEIARLAVTLGHIGAINLLLTTAAGARLLRPFVAAGRTALTLYVAQTLICLWVLFPPFGLALYGRLTWWPLMVVAFAIDVVLLWGANLYVRHYDIAPVEWAWRSLVEGRRLPWRRRATMPA